MSLSSPIVRVQIETDAEPLEYIVQTDNRDMVQNDVIRARRGWPSMKDAPILNFTVVAWNALRRSGAIGTQNLDDFMEKCIDVTAVDADGNPIKSAAAVEAASTVDPTQPVPDTGY